MSASDDNGLGLALDALGESLQRVEAQLIESGFVIRARVLLRKEHDDSEVWVGFGRLANKKTLFLERTKNGKEISCSPLGNVSIEYRMMVPAVLDELLAALIDAEVAAKQKIRDGAAYATGFADRVAGMFPRKRP